MCHRQTNQSTRRLPCRSNLGKNQMGQSATGGTARYEVNGKRSCDNLGVKITGKPPASLSLMDEGDTAFERKEGLRRASVRDCHSFRVTWVTLALTAGVPQE